MYYYLQKRNLGTPLVMIVSPESCCNSYGGKLSSKILCYFILGQIGTPALFHKISETLYKFLQKDYNKTR